MVKKKATEEEKQRRFEEEKARRERIRAKENKPKDDFTIAKGKERAKGAEPADKGFSKDIGVLDKAGEKFVVPQKETPEFRQQLEEENIRLQQEERRLLFGQAGATDIKEGLRAEPEDLAPTEGKGEVLLERGAALGLTPLEGIINTIRGAGGIEPVTSEQLAETKTGKVLGNILLAGGTVLAALSGQALLSLAVRTTIGSSVGGLIAKNKLLGGIIVGTLLDDTGNLTGFVTDKDRGDINTYVGRLSKLEGRLSSLQSGISGGAYNDDPLEALAVVASIVKEIDDVETNLKRLGNENLKYRNDKEYLEHMDTIATTRQNALERINVIETVFATGRPTPNPESLVQSVESLEEEDD